MGAWDTFKDSAKSLIGGNKKAILEVADFSERKIQEENAQKPSAGKPGISSVGGFSTEAMNKYGKALDNIKSSVDDLVGGGKDGFDYYQKIKKYRFEVQFNPEEISITGYGGEELPINTYRTKDKNGKEEVRDDKEKNPNQIGDVPLQGSHMASASTRIDMRFKLIFDQVNIQDAFFADKFTLSQTNIVKGVGSAIKKGVGKVTDKAKQGHWTVQTEVEALTAIVRDQNKRLARFAWGDMAYEGVINHVSAEYVMFNVNGEPIRAFVNISMILFDAEVSGANTNIWKNEYMKDFGSLGDPTKNLQVSM
ncbi:MAG: hypothetical protein K6E91_02465 [Butyrivibrio sp.]|nr:hypothetical protein [Butyrivibrio sp.]